MRPATALHLYRIRLRARLGAELLALLGIAAGVALVFAALVANTSLNGSVRQLGESLVGEADLQVAARGPDGVGAGVVPRVRSAVGVVAVAPVLEARGNLVGPGGRRSILLVGVDPRFRRVGGGLSRAVLPARDRARAGLALPAPLAARLGVGEGDGLRVETGARASAVRVADVLGADRIGAIARSPVALAPLLLAQALAGLPGRVSRVFVRAAPGGERRVERGLRAATGGRLDVAPADREAALFERVAYPTNQSTTLFSALSAVVGFLLAVNAMLLMVPQRRRLIGDLRLAGYEPRTIVALLLLDALLLGAVAALLGLTLGEQLSRHLFDSAPGYLSSAFAVGEQRIVTWQSVALPAATGVLAACVAVLGSVRDALARELRPAAGGPGSRREGWVAAAGLFLLGATVAILLLAPRAALAGIGALALSLLCMLPACMRLAASAFELLGRRLRSPVAILALLELSSGSTRSRTLALTATGAVAVFATVGIGGARADLQRGLDAVSAESSSGAAVWVSLRGPADIFATAPFAVPPERLAAVRRLPGVRGLVRRPGSFLDVGADRVWVLAPPPAADRLLPPSQVRSGYAATAEARLRRGGWLTLSERLAERLGAEVGGRVVLPAPSPRTFRVAALTTNFGWPGGAVVIDAGDYARAWNGPAPSAIGLALDPGASPAAVADAARRILGDRGRLRVETRARRTARQEASARAGLARLDQIAATVLIAAILAMAASTGGAIWQRRATFAALKVHGFGEGRLWRALLLESALLLGSGCFAGAAFGLLGQLLLDRALETITGFPVVYATALPAALTSFVLVTAVAVAVLAIPGRLAVRVRPAAGLAS